MYFLTHDEFLQKYICWCFFCIHVHPKPTRRAEVQHKAANSRQMLHISLSYYALHIMLGAGMNICLRPYPHLHTIVQHICALVDSAHRSWQALGAYPACINATPLARSGCEFKHAQIMGRHDARKGARVHTHILVRPQIAHAKTARGSHPGKLKLGKIHADCFRCVGLIIEQTQHEGVIRKGTEPDLCKDSIVGGLDFSLVKYLLILSKT